MAIPEFDEIDREIRQQQENTPYEPTDLALMKKLAHQIKTQSYHNRLMSINYAGVFVSLFIDMSRYENRSIYEAGEWLGFRATTMVSTLSTMPLFITIMSDATTAKLQVHTAKLDPGEDEKYRLIPDAIAFSAVAGKITEDGREISYDKEYQGPWSYGISVEPRALTWPDKTGRSTVYAALLNSFSGRADSRVSPYTAHQLWIGDHQNDLPSDGE